jgi:flagellar motor switch protein FliG
MNGAERAAVLLMTLGEKEAAEVLKHIGAKDVQRVGSVMAQLSGISRDAVTEVLSGFNREIENQTSLGVGADDYVRNVLVSALGDKAGGLIDRILLGRSSKGLESLKWMDPRAIAEMVRQEHPQIVAIVLSYIDPDQAASVLSLLPEWLRVDSVMRIATLDGIQPHALNELDDILEKKFAGSQGGKSSSLGGPKVAAGILNFLDGTSETAVMEHIKQVDETLGQRIQDLMFVFENLNTLDDRDMQTLLREVQNDQLLLALKGCDEALRDKVFRNMSQRAAEMLKDDLEAKGPVRLAEVEAAQKAILASARTLADQGKINLGGKGEEYV